MRRYPSIFNDVIGPVMRGPSASHCAASVRIGRICRDLMNADIESVIIEFDRNGSLATTYKTQGSEIGIYAGLLGWDVSDERLVNSKKFIKDAGIKVEFEITDSINPHPNTYRITLRNSNEKHEVVALSIGGGIIEVIEIDGVGVLLAGDFFETFIWHGSEEEELKKYLVDKVEADALLFLKGKGNNFVEIKSQRFLSGNVISEIKTKFPSAIVKEIKPVLPILSRKGMFIPFLTCNEMFMYNKNKNLELWQLAVNYESSRGNLSSNEVFQRMKEIVQIMMNSIREGILGTNYSDRILHQQSPNYERKMKADALYDGDLLNHIILSVTALMEMKSSMGIIVAAPTAGSCGTLPGSVLGAGSAMKISIDDMTKAMFAAGMIGVFIAANSTFAAEVCGCQAECGAGSGMAAAALVTLKRGTLKQSVSAASLALQNILGMICDPVANRVEVPCLGRNVLGAVNALACANMALADYEEVIPLDEVILTMDLVGKSLPRELRCTALGGLSVTETAKDIERKLYRDTHK